MGNSGGAPAPYTPPPPNPMPIKDDIQARHDAAAMLSKQQSTASHDANDLGEGATTSDPAVTRASLGATSVNTNTLSPQGPARGPRPRDRAPSAMANSGMNGSAVVTG